MLSALLLLATLQSASAPVVVRDGLSIQIPPSPLAVVRKDPVEAAILGGQLVRPKAGDALAGVWKAIHADRDGWLSAENGYVAVEIESRSPRTVLLSPLGASFFYLNGAPEPGDVYETGYLSQPVRLKRGTNVVFLRCARGRVQLRVSEVSRLVALDNRDTTLPDVIRGETAALWGALLVSNSTDQTLSNLVIEASTADGLKISTPVGPVLPLSVRKAGFRFVAPAGGAVQIRLLQREVGRTRSREPIVDEELDRSSVSVRVRKPTETYKRTFLSDIDGTVQYYAVNPATGVGSIANSPAGGNANAQRPALVLSLHGASVEAMGQADAYSSKSWLNLVTPTNRRPYGFDWEDWGREDALEVLGLAKQTLEFDPQRVYLAGHSMGGHGTWQLGVLYPDLFAAIGPSAAWISSYSYAGAKKPENPTPLQSLLARANGVGDTISMAENYGAEGVYILHGGADDNVPVTEARHMADLLKGFHHDFVYHEEPGQGHWWDLSPEPGADCVDWAPMYDFFARHALPPIESVRDIDFATANPGVSSKLRWATIDSQEQEGAISRMVLHVDPHLRKFSGTTANVHRMSLDLAPLAGEGDINLALDGQSSVVHPPTSGNLELEKLDGHWTATMPAAAGQKNPSRYGPLRLAFNHRMLFVYGTHGTPEENAWSLAKAKYDSETFWYRGNGSPDVIPDTSFEASINVDRDVILYGNADTNTAWPQLLSSSPVQVRRGSVSVGKTSFGGKNLACAFLRPRAGSDIALVAAISGSGLAGMRATNNIPYLQPMIGFPDILVVDSSYLTTGLDAIKLAGFFGRDWGVESGEFVLP